MGSWLSRPGESELGALGSDDPGTGLPLISARHAPCAPWRHGLASRPMIGRSLMLPKRGGPASTVQAMLARSLYALGEAAPRSCQKMPSENPGATSWFRSNVAPTAA